MFAEPSQKLDGPQPSQKLDGAQLNGEASQTLDRAPEASQTLDANNLAAQVDEEDADEDHFQPSVMNFLC